MAQLTTLTTPPETRTFTVRKGTNTHNGTLQVPCVVIPGTLVYITTAASQISYNGRPSTEVNDILPPGTVLACQRRGNQTTYAIFRPVLRGAGGGHRRAAASGGVSGCSAQRARQKRRYKPSAGESAQSTSRAPERKSGRVQGEGSGPPEPASVARAQRHRTTNGRP